MQLLIGERSLVPGLAFPNYRGLVSTRSGEMPVQTIFRNVQFSADKPFRERRFPFDNLLPRRSPDQFLRFTRPELGRLPDRFSIHSPILSEALDSRFTAETGCWLENAFFDQMRFNVVVHGQSPNMLRNIFRQAAAFALAIGPVDGRPKARKACYNWTARRAVATP